MTDLIDLADIRTLAWLRWQYRIAGHGQRRAALQRLQNEVHRQLRRTVRK